MASTFKGKSLFSSGPHRTAVGPEGQQLVPRLALNEQEAGHAALGPLDTRITIRGRLVAPDVASLNALRESIRDELEPDPTAGTLVDTHGRVWEGVIFASYTEEGRVELGRAASLGYSAEFVRLSEPSSDEQDDEEGNDTDGSGT